MLVVTAGDDAGSTLALLRAAYHLGNRHVPLEVRADRLLLEPDHVLAEMLVRMDLRVDEASGPFEPQAGAYDTASSGHGHHDHGHGQDDAHGHGHAHEVAP